MGRTLQRETDLYEPVRDHLLAQGYTVRAEVRGCDIAAYKDGRIVVVELKRQLSVDLLIQAIDRQAVADGVYIAVPAPRGADRVRRTRGIRRLLRRLGLGLLYIESGQGPTGVRAVCDPAPSRKRGTSKARRVMLEEMVGRSGGQNLGGSTRREIVTAYRENALFIAVCLNRYGPLDPQALRSMGAGPKTTSILYRNVYGWFDHPSRGVYALSQQGRLALHRYADLARAFSELLDGSDASEEPP
jgi:hypothetical protein